MVNRARSVAKGENLAIPTSEVVIGLRSHPPPEKAYVFNAYPRDIIVRRRIAKTRYTEFMKHAKGSGLAL